MQARSNRVAGVVRAAPGRGRWIRDVASMPVFATTRQYRISTRGVRLITTQTTKKDALEVAIKDDTYCPGCGAKFQHSDPSSIGYIPLNNKTLADRDQAVKSLQNNSLEDEVVLTVKELKLLKSAQKVRVCKRCHDLRYKSLDSIRAFPGELDKFWERMRKKTYGVVVVVVDIFDFSNDFARELGKLMGIQRKVVVGVNKCDALPEDTDFGRVRRWVYRQLKELNVEVEDIHLISAKSGMNMEGFLNAVASKRVTDNDDVWLVGCTNVGKSRIISTLSEIMGQKGVVTISPSPGTTAEIIKIPWMNKKKNDRKSNHSGGYIIDTPGLMNSNSLMHLLTLKEMRMVVPKAVVKPINIDFLPGSEGKCLYIGGLARMDFIDGDDRLTLTIFRSNMVPLHKTSVEKSETLYGKHLGGNSDHKILMPPLMPREKLWPGLTNMKEFEITGIPDRKAIKDIVIPGLGWVSISGKFKFAKLQVWTPPGVEAFEREPLLPLEYRKGRRLRLTGNQTGSSI